MTDLTEMGGMAAETYEAQLVAELAAGVHERFARSPAADPAQLGSPAELARRMLAVVPNVSEWNELLGPVYDTAGLTRYLGVSKQALADRVSRRRLLAMTTSDRKLVYPAFQFAGLDLIAGLPDVLGVFRDVPVDGWTLASWLLAPSDSLEGLSVIDWLRAGRDTAIARAHAQAAAWRWRQ